MSICAYCKLDCSLTREHIVPAFMYDFQKELESKVIGWNEVAGKMVHGELKIKDVCDKCNNVHLSALDSYGKDMLVGAGLMVQNYTKLTLALEYEYDSLARWLLKLSFNSARTDGVHAPLFEELIPYILGNAVTPRRSKFAVLGYLAGPELLSEEKKSQSPYSKIVGSSNRLNPFLMRICYGSIPGKQEYTLRLTIIGPLVFFMLMFPDEILPGTAAVAIRNLIKVVPGAKELQPSLKLIPLSAGKMTWLDLYQDQISRVRQLD